MIDYELVLVVVSAVFVFVEKVPNWYHEQINKFPEIIGKPLGKCLTCMTGQTTLWASVFYYGFDFEIIIGTVSFSMLISELLQRLVSWLEK